jgi:hypothetical protein
MIRCKKVNAASILLLIGACFICPHPVPAQQPQDASHFGANEVGSGSTTSVGVPVRVTGSGGKSTWGAGKQSFGTSVQTGGVWRDGAALGAATPGTRTAKQDRASAKDASPPSGAPPPLFFGPKPTNARGNAAPGKGPILRSSATSAIGRATMSKSSGTKHTAGRSRSRTRFNGPSDGKRETRPSSGLASGAAQRTSALGVTADSFHHDVQHTESTNSGLESLRQAAGKP